MICIITIHYDSHLSKLLHGRVDVSKKMVAMIVAPSPRLFIIKYRARFLFININV